MPLLARRWMVAGSLVVLALAGTGCAMTPSSRRVQDAHAKERNASVDRPAANVDIAKARAQHRSQGFAWMKWEPATFAKAEAEQKLILVDGAAAWCHWCHVMDETTYADEEVGAVLRERFITIRVDIDERPDLAERYGEWGWPATIILSPHAEEIGKLRGYVTRDELLPVLRSASPAWAKMVEPPPEPTAPIDALGWIGARVSRDLDSYYDDKQGGWGMRQKAPLGANIELMLTRARAGDTSALSRARQSLDAQRSLIDRVSGGMYQYSAGSDWSAPHFEKLLTVQAANLEAYAKAFAVTRDAGYLGDARDIERFMGTVLSSPDGGFFATQDADVNAHDPSAPFIEGKVYYAKSERDRRALGMPRVDEHVYAFENGRAIAALVSLYEATQDPAVLARAERAADRILATHVTPEGEVKHEAEAGRELLYLTDAASFGRALVRLARVSGEARYRDAALRVAGTLSGFRAPGGGALYGQSAEPHAAGVFSRRRRPFEANVIAARFLAGLASLTGDTSYRDQGRVILAGLSTPSELDGQGRMTGEFLLALAELDAS